MRSRTGNSLSTLMFLVPMFGVPLMAIFGVPQFVPVIASSVSEEAARPKGPRPKQRVGSKDRHEAGVRQRSFRRLDGGASSPAGYGGRYRTSQR